MRNTIKQESLPSQAQSNKQNLSATIEYSLLVKLAELDIQTAVTATENGMLAPAPTLTAGQQQRVRNQE